MDDEAGDGAMHDEAMRWTMRRCYGRCGDAMDDAAMLWTMRRCGNIAPSHRLIVHRIAPSCIASPHCLKRQCEPSLPSYVYFCEATGSMRQNHHRQC